MSPACWSRMACCGSRAASSTGRSFPRRATCIALATNLAKESPNVNDHRDESLMDKVKNAFGMGSHDDDHDHIDDADTTRAEVPGRTTFDDDDLSDSGNRPAGPDYGAGSTLDAGDRVDTGFGTADRVSTADTVETVEVDYGPPPTTAAAGTE